MYFVLGLAIYLAIGAAFAVVCWRSAPTVAPEDDIEFHPAYVAVQVLLWLPFAIGIAIEAAVGLKGKLPKPTRPRQLRMP